MTIQRAIDKVFANHRIYRHKFSNKQFANALIKVLEALPKHNQTTGGMYNSYVDLILVSDIDKAIELIRKKVNE